MSINSGKTKSMLIIGKRSEKKISSLDLKSDIILNGSTIAQVHSKKHLGIMLDRYMSYDDHIDALCKQLSKRLGFLKHISPYLREEQREIYYITGLLSPNYCTERCVVVLQ